MTLPTIHSNGTSAERLFKHYLDAREAVSAAYEAMRLTSPNGRDYYPQGPDAMTAADNEHMSRLKRLDGVLGELDVLLEHCYAETANA